jgi:DNA-binding response OmpR family regulator
MNNSPNNQEMSKAKILYVEDDETLSFITKDHLELQGYEILHAATGNDALHLIREDAFDIAILDVMLPQVDGFEIARKLREKDAEIPILFLTAKSMKEDRLEGFKLGGDDYITKPFSIEELMLRIEVFLKRRKISNVIQKETFQLGIYTFNYPNLTLQCGEKIDTLTQKEADLLRFFANRPNQVLKRADILTTIWGEDDYFLGRSLDVFISRLRKYLKADNDLKIENLHGVGFKFVIH